MRKHIFRDCLSLILVVAMIFSISVDAFAANTDNKQTSKAKEIAQSLKVKTEDAEVEKPLVSVYVANADLKEPVISISVDNTFLQKCPELRINVSCEGMKDAICEDVLYIGKESITLKELTTETTYYITAQGTHDVSVDNFIGYFILHEKNDELSVEYKINHETQMIREYNETYIRELNRASDLLQEANDKYGCYNKEKALLDDKAAPVSETETLNYAATLLAEYATASVRYEVESNNTMALADRVYDDDTTYGTIGYSGDVDYYKVQFTSAGNANFWLGDIPSGQDYDFYLYNASGTLLRSSTSTSNQEQIYNYPVTANTWYYMKVIGYNGSYNASSYYRVRAKNYPAVASGDSYEPNNTFSTATSISNTATITSANIHDASDVDYYRFTIPSTSSVSISLSNIPTNCDYDLVLYNSSQTQCASSAMSGNTSESITYAAAPGTYYIKVYSYSGSSSSNYRLTLSTSVTSNPDSYETNNTLSTATYITVPTTLNANIHTASDIDYYRFTISETKNVVITLSNIPSGCDYDLELWRSSGMITSSKNGSNNTETITTTLTTGTYYVKVYSYSGSSSSSYRLSVSTSTPMVYGNFSRYITTPTVPSNITIPLQTIENEYDVWPAGEISNYYGLTTMQRAEILADIYERAIATVIGGLFAQPAGSYLNHFLDNNGQEKTIAVNDFMNEDSTALSDRNSEINSVLLAAENLSINNGTVTFCSVEHHEFDPSVFGWVNSIGTYSTKQKCTVTRNGSSYTATIVYYLYDVYDWDRTKTSMGWIPVSPREMWELQYGGLAKGYYSNGSKSYSVTWTTGQRIGTGASIV